MGYEWNDYNKKHFTLLNPPPKQILGYRFQMFYPHASSPPDYFLTNLKDPNFVLITFTASQPYEDLVFKIKNAPWNMKDRRTFKCEFQDGVLSLFFDFVRFTHRR